MKTNTYASCAQLLVAKQTYPNIQLQKEGSTLVCPGDPVKKNTENSTRLILHCITYYYYTNCTPKLLLQILLRNAIPHLFARGIWLF